MLLAKQRFLFFGILISYIYIVSWIIQDSLFLNWDIGHLINSSMLLWAGGNYTQDFFIPNTPTILHLYLPPVIANHFFHVNLVLGFRLYIYLLVTLSLSLSYFLLRNIFAEKDRLFAYLLICLLAITLLLVPFYEFGQRDHLLVIFSIPYLLVVAYQLQGHGSRLRYAAIGLFAAIGFAIKPQFLVTPVLIEAYFMLSKRKLTAWVRPEVLTIILFMIGYTTFALILYPDYFLKVVPYLMGFYYKAVGDNWNNLLFNPLILFCYLPIGFYFIQYKNKAYKELHTVLFIALISFIITYLSQRTTFYYHFLPAFTIGSLLLTSQFMIMLSTENINELNYPLLGLFAWSIFILFVHPLQFVALIFALHPLAIFSGFFIVFSLVLYLVKKEIKVIYYAGLITVLSMLFSEMTSKTNLFFHQFYLTITMLFITFLLVAAHYRQHAFRLTFVALLGVLLITFPYKIMMSIYWSNLDYKEKVLNKLIHFIHTQPPHQSIYSFSIKTNYSSPLTYYTNATLAQRFDCLWMVQGLVKSIAEQGQQVTRQYIKDNKDPYFFINMIAADFKKNKPDLIFVDTSLTNTHFVNKEGQLQKTYFNFISYFSENIQFKQEWQHYRYLTTLKEDKPFPFQLSIYKRIH